MENIKIQYFKSPVGELVIGSYRQQLCLCDWRYHKMRNEIDERIKKFTGANFLEEDCQLIGETIGQLNEYFKGKRKVFNLPVYLAGTDFQKRIWEELQKIPYGKTETYASLSEKMGDIKSIRAVAAANGANAISIIIPCHRIIGSDGKLIGYAGGLQAKQKLLLLEGALSDWGQLKIFQ
jgi:methylated-DNA-[protein]-cysteine S-methyltransferase